MKSIKIKSPAKINLFLEVVCKRTDSYHEIKTVMVKIGLWDIIDVKLTRSNRVLIDSDSGEIPSGPDNIAYKAAALFFKTAGIKNKGAEISIRKNIPVAAGLGGGSGNAAAVLSALNRLCGGRFDRLTLADLAAKLGCDIPFFLKDGPALCLGRGDEVVPLKAGKNFWIVLVSPKKGRIKGPACKTKEVYAALNFDLTKDIHDIKMTLYALESCDLDKISMALFNRLEEVAFIKDPGLIAVKKELLMNGARGALLSGSGPTVYGIAADKNEAVSIKRRVLKKFGAVYDAFVVKTI